MMRMTRNGNGKATHFQVFNEQTGKWSTQCGSVNNNNHKTIIRELDMEVTLENITCKKCRKLYEKEHMVEEVTELKLGDTFEIPRKGAGKVLWSSH